MAIKRIRKYAMVVTCFALMGFTILPFMGCGSGGGGSSSNNPAPAPTPTTTPNILASQTSLDFAGVVLNSSVDQTVEITNTGNANLSIGQITNSGPNPPFSIAGDDCSNKALSPSQKCLLRVRFAPKDSASFSGTISIPSNDPDSNVVTIRLQGEGYGLNVWINKVSSDNCQGIIDVTVTDPANPGILLDSLTTQNFKVYENGTQVQGISVNQNEYPSPVSVVLALDYSESELGVLDSIKTAANSFVSLLNAWDNAAICKFNAAIKIDPGTGFIIADAGGKSTLSSYIGESFPQTGATLLFSALLQSIEKAAQGPTNKRAVIVLSDGIVQSDPITGLDQVIAFANQQGIPIFTIYYVDPNYTFYTQEQIANGLLTMQRLANESGGQYYNGLSSDLTEVFGLIANVLSNKYTLTYTPSACSGTFSLDVRADWNNLYGVDSATITF